LFGSGWAEGGRSSGLPEGSAGLAGTDSRVFGGVFGVWRVSMAGGGGRRWNRPTRRLALNEILDIRDPGDRGGAGAGAGGLGDGGCEIWCAGDGNGTGAMSGGGLGGLCTADQSLPIRPIGERIDVEMGTFERC